MRPVFAGSSNNIAKRNYAAYIGDGNGIARKVYKMYIGDNTNTARLCYSADTGLARNEDGTITNGQVLDIGPIAALGFQYFDVATIMFKNKGVLMGGSNSVSYGPYSSEIDVIDSSLTITMYPGALSRERNNICPVIVNDKYLVCINGKTFRGSNDGSSVDFDYAKQIDVFDSSFTSITGEASSIHVYAPSAASLGSGAIIGGGTDLNNGFNAFTGLYFMDENLTITSVDTVVNNNKELAWLGGKDFALCVANMNTPLTKIDTSYTATQYGSSHYLANAHIFKCGDYYMCTGNNSKDQNEVYVYDSSFTEVNTLNTSVSYITNYADVESQAIIVGGLDPTTDRNMMDVVTESLTVEHSNLADSVSLNGFALSFEDKIVFEVSANGKVLILDIE